MDDGTTDIPLPVDPLGVASTAFRCPQGSRMDPYCVIGQGQLSLELVPQGTLVVIMVVVEVVVVASSERFR